jgi:hypothetical protein
VFDFSGKKIKTVEAGNLPAGRSTVLIFNEIQNVQQAYRVQMTIENGQTGGEILIKKR